MLTFIRHCNHSLFGCHNQQFLCEVLTFLLPAYLVPKHNLFANIVHVWQLSCLLNRYAVVVLRQIGITLTFCRVFALLWGILFFCLFCNNSWLIF